MKKNYRILVLTLCAALLTSTALPAFAESAPNTQVSSTPQAKKAQREKGQRKPGMPEGSETIGRKGFGTTNGAFKRTHDGYDNALTDEQKALWESAIADRQAAYREYLGKLADAGIVSAEAIAAYDRVQQQNALAETVNTDQWTVEKDRALKEALKLSGQEKKTALDVFVAEGLLTQEQEDALIATSTSILDIDIDRWTVADVKKLTEAMRESGNELVAVVNDFIANGLLTQSEADTILCVKLTAQGKRLSSSLTEEQKVALEAAQKTLKERYMQIQDSLKTSTNQTQGQL